MAAKRSVDLDDFNLIWIASKGGCKVRSRSQRAARKLMKIRFPKAFAAGQSEFRRRSIDFVPPTRRLACEYVRPMFWRNGGRKHLDEFTGLADHNFASAVSLRKNIGLSEDDHHRLSLSQKGI